MRKILVIVAALIMVCGGGAAWYFLTTPPAELVQKMYWAVREGDVSKIKGLLAENKRLARAKYKGDDSMLVTAACIYSPIPHQTEVCQILLESGADPNENCGAPLHGAIYCGNTDLAKLLLTHGANPHVKPVSKEGKTPYEEAKWRETEDIVKLFDAWKK